jgi:predicted PurR-regulated permease PerM
VRQQTNTWFLFALAALALYLLYLVAQPFLNAIFAAVVLAVVFRPLHTRIDIAVGRPNLAATLSTVVVILAVAIPATVLAFVGTRELGDLYNALSEHSAAEGALARTSHGCWKGPPDSWVGILICPALTSDRLYSDG